MSDTIKAGDIIKVKSGGPKMTVSEVAEDTFGTMTVWCSWFDDKNKNQSGTFPLNTVVKVAS